MRFLRTFLAVALLLGAQAAVAKETPLVCHVTLDTFGEYQFPTDLEAVLYSDLGPKKVFWLGVSEHFIQGPNMFPLDESSSMYTYSRSTDQNDIRFELWRDSLKMSFVIYNKKDPVGVISYRGACRIAGKPKL